MAKVGTVRGHSELQKIYKAEKISKVAYDYLVKKYYANLLTPYVG